LPTIREIRRNIGNYRWHDRKLMEGAYAITVAASGTVETAELVGYPADTTNYFNMYGMSVVSGASYGDEKIVTLFTVATGKITFVPAETLTAADIFELWQRGLSASVVNNYIYQAIDTIREETLQEWHDSGPAYESGREDYIIPSGAKFVHSVQILDAPIETGLTVDNLSTFRALFDAAARTQLRQGFKVGSDCFVRGVSLYLRAVGTLSAATLTANIEEGTTLVTGASGTRAATTYVNALGQYVFFDFGRRVRLTGGTQYYVTLDTGLAGADASNYVAWGEDDTNGYADGNLAVASDEGTTWTESTGSDAIFQLVGWSDDWDGLLDSDWDISSESSNIFLRILGASGRPLPIQLGMSPSILEGQPVRLLGYTQSDRPANTAAGDTADLEVNRAYVENYALAQVLNSLGDPALQPTVQYLMALAQRELQQHPVRTNLRHGSRRVSILN